MKIEVYTDGACNLNKINGEYFKGCGGAAGVIIIDNVIISKFSKSFLKTTNNEMELYAILRAMYDVYNLQDFSNVQDEVIIYSDSSYSLNSINTWASGWEKKNWKTNKGEIVKNLNLIKSIYYFKSKFKNIKFIKVKGHDINEGNNEADRLAVKGKMIAKEFNVNTNVNTLIDKVNKIL